MSEARLCVTDLDTGTLHGLPTAQVVTIAQPTALSERQLLGSGTLLLRQTDPRTGRTDGNLTWTIRFPGLTDHRARPINSRQLISLLQGWRNRATQLTLSGPELRGLASESLRRETTGAYANKRFWGSHPWWAAGVAIYQDGVLQSSGYTNDADDGSVTFDSAVTAGVVVTASGDRAPRVQIVGIETVPVPNTVPTVYDVTATFREVTPA